MVLFNQVGIAGIGWSYLIILTAEIPPEVKPGDYDVTFILFINEEYQGTLPCTTHVVNKSEVLDSGCIMPLIKAAKITLEY